MEFKTLNIEGVNYQWAATQDSEPPDYVLVADAGEIWVQVEINSRDRSHNELFLKGKVECPISEDTALKVAEAVVKQGYIDSYFNTDVGLIFTEEEKLIEN